MPESIHDRVDRERKAGVPEPDKIRLYREYAEGRQRGTIGAEQRAVLNSLIGHDHADNICDTVLATVASRVEFTGFTVADADVQAALDDLIVRNGLIELQYDVHYPAARDGNHALGLEWRADRPSPLIEDDQAPALDPGGRVVVSHEPWWDGKTGVFVAYEDDGRTPAYAVKDFRVMLGDPPRDRLRRVIWFPDHIERYIKDGSGWIPFRLESDPDGPIEWKKRDGSPLGIPIVHFPNGRFGKSPYGVSDLAGGVIGLQDDVNDFQRDLSAAGRMTAYQMFWVTGHNVGTNPITVGPGVLMWSENAEANFGSFAAGSLEQIIGGHRAKIETIARNTRTPQHLITGGDWPSGEALIRAESPLVDRSRGMIRSVSPSWATLAHRATELINAFGRGTLDEAKLIRATFTPAERRDELTLQQIERERLQALLLLRDLGFSWRAIQEKYGLSPEEITAMKDERKQELIDAGQTIPFREEAEVA